MTTYSFDLGQVRGGIRILGFFEDLAALTAGVSDPDPGDIYAVGTAAPYRYYCWDGLKRVWVDNGALQGDKGEDGSCWWFASAGTFYSEGESLRVLYQSMSGLEPPNADTVKVGDLLLYEDGVYQVSRVSSGYCYCQNKHLSLLGPAGAIGPSGAAGQAATIQIGSVTTGETGSGASVSNVGTETAAILNFQLPRGEQGIQGERGQTGPRGATGSPGADGNKWWMASALTPDGNYGRFYYADMSGMHTASASSVFEGDLILCEGQVYTVSTVYSGYCRASYAGVDLKGESFRILGYYASLSALQSAVPSPAAGDAYGVGSAAPYDIYIWDGINGDWINNGKIQGSAGADGADGADGATFRPSVTAAGVLSWTNDKGLPNPSSVNIKGPQGEKGDAGADGAPGAQGPQGPQGEKGEAGPNEVSTATASSISGMLKGSGGKLAAAVAGTDYLSPGAKGAANGLASLDSSSKLSADQASARTLSVTASKTLALTDAGCLLQVNSGSACTLTIPANSSVNFPKGTEIEILRYGSGDVTIAANSGVTIRCSETTHKITKQYGGASLKKLATNEWLLMGNLG